MDIDDVLAILTGATLLGLITALVVRSRRGGRTTAPLVVAIAVVLLMSLFLVTEEAS
ncbi:MAG TPA: hypothetical protein VIB11_08600 [Pedococcus sp.]|jgi:hypothetical protein|uniref:hypothetical protein n=1 Tax=Pedococcus sp. TaxID=2860345 RepID=UPI002F920401